VLAGRYRVDAVIGRGGFATVYRGHHLRLDTPVAIKVLRFADDSPAEARALVARRFDEECRVLTRLRHDHIVRTLDQGLTEADSPEEARPYLVTELCSDGTLDTLLKPTRGRGFAISIAWPLMRAILEGLAYAHAQGVAHRDLKPQNLMLARDASSRFTPRLIDFGIAKLAAPRDPELSGESLTAGTPVYTPAYAAPEQVAGARTGPATDVHALGLLFIELLTGHPPYGESGDPHLAIIDAVRPTAARSGIVTGAFEPVIARAVALRSAERFADGRALRDALRSAARDQFGEGHPVPSARQQQVATSSVPGLRTGPKRAALTAALLALVVASIALIVPHFGSRPSAPPASVETPPDSEAPVVAGSFCDLKESAALARLIETGLRVHSFTRALTTLEGDADSVLTIETLTLGEDAAVESRAALEEAVVGVRQIESLGLAYALQGHCLIHVKGARAEVAPIMRTLLAGLDAEQRGDTAGGPDPLGLARPTPPAWQGKKASSLATLSAEELIVRAVGAGIRIHDADRRDQRLGQWLELRFKRDEVRGRFEYLAGPYARTLLMEKLGKAASPVYYVIEEPVVIVAHGLPDPSLLERLVSGLPATVLQSAP
jgi:serine/threonine protein kinase